VTILRSRVGFVEPMMPALVDEAPEGSDWIHELKYDGYRTELALNGDDRRAFTRRGHDWSHLYGSILDTTAGLDCDAALIDGEVIVQDRHGLSDFAALRSELARRKSGGLVFMAFDLLHLNGTDLRSRPVEERRERLRDLLGENEAERPIQFSDHLTGGGPDFFALAERSGAEGIVSKKLGSRYRSGPARTWLKTKAFTESEFVVIGAAKGDLAPVALLARETDDRRLEYVGAAMVTFAESERERFWRAMERLSTETPPIHMKAPRESSWVRPDIRVRVRHLRGEEMLRHATVKSLSYMPPARKAPAPPRGRSDEPSYGVGPDAVPPPERLLDYYGRLGPFLLPFLAKRPLNLFRCSPDRAGECVFQRNRMHPPRPESLFPPPIRDVPVLQKNGRTERYLYVDNVEGLLACVAAETVEFHAWGCRVPDIERPDRIAIDLDPDEGLSFGEVKRTAFEVREGLEAMGLTSFALLTGGKGIHVVIPFAPSGEWAEVRGFAQAFCSALARAEPERFTIDIRKERRRGRIFLDYLRNQRTATAIMPYSARAKPDAPVAAPVSWDELERIDSARHFTMADAEQLIHRARGRLRRWGVVDQHLPAWKTDS
jgi:bifunctional non-homologous end joining protein LigD